ncbi:hypothetical protein Anas_12044 [Armadillidium nasatum]|uniref:ZP domain-containing protein n=1 Tax=Armadillidium nasatum TaxID=96803 RepID=A0A5N5T2V8_9CRUS|nr:hypothetical protein Anas_12044 [Armadillidium nasatum]
MFIYFTLTFLLVVFGSSSLSAVKKDAYSEIPKVKRLQETKHVKDYVERRSVKSFEHDDHSHIDDFRTHENSGLSNYDRIESINAPGEAAKFQTPSNPSESLLEPVRRVEDTKVDCHKSHMTVMFRFSAPFNGYVYPHDHFTKCIMFSGQNSYETTLTLYHGICGQKQIANANEPDFSAIIEHRLMIQWERDFMCEDDSSVIVRCDRPDDFNKTISWNFRTLSLSSTIERNTHPGPKMWMEIQRGEGPNAPPLDDKPVFIGDILTLVFTLSDDVFWFGSNILSCSAVDGGDKEEIQELNPYSSVKTYTGKMTVIENECSTKPKIFSHFYKERITQNGNLETLHYAHFKAFRFPTSQKVVIQCDVQVCYKKCEALPPCSVGFQPRATKERKRRALPRNVSDFEEGTELDTVLLYRTIEVFSAEDGALKEIPVKSVVTAAESRELVEKLHCYSPRTFFGLILSFAAVIIFLTGLFIWNFSKQNMSKTMEPTK